MRSQAAVEGSRQDGAAFRLHADQARHGADPAQLKQIVKAFVQSLMMLPSPT